MLKVHTDCGFKASYKYNVSVFILSTWNRIFAFTLSCCPWQWNLKKWYNFNVITWPILVHIISNFNSMLRNKSNFYLLFFLRISVYRCRNIKHWKRSRFLCDNLLEHNRLRLCSVHFWENSQKGTNCNANLDMARKVQKGKAVWAGQQNLNEHQHRKRCFENIWKPGFLQRQFSVPQEIAWECHHTYCI